MTSSLKLSSRAHTSILLHSVKYGTEDVHGLLLGSSAGVISDAWPLFHGPVVGSLCELALRTASALASSRKLLVLGLYYSSATTAATTTQNPSLSLSSFILARLSASSSSAASSSASASSSSSSTSFSDLVVLVLETTRLTQLETEGSNFSVFRSSSRGLSKTDDSPLVDDEAQAISSVIFSSEQRELQIQAILRFSDYFDHVADLRRDFTNSLLLDQLATLSKTS